MSWIACALPAKIALFMKRWDSLSWHEFFMSNLPFANFFLWFDRMQNFKDILFPALIIGICQTRACIKVPKTLLNFCGFKVICFNHPPCRQQRAKNLRVLLNFACFVIRRKWIHSFSQLGDFLVSFPLPRMFFPLGLWSTSRKSFLVSFYRRPKYRCTTLSIRERNQTNKELKRWF